MIKSLHGRRMKKIYVRISNDFITCIVLAVGICIMQSSLVEPYKRGFFLDDESIRYPITKNTVKFNLVIYAGIAFNVFWILLIEHLLSIFLPRSAKSLRLVEEVKHVRLLTMLGPWLLLLHLLVNFSMGAAFTNLATDIPKFFFGRLRPYFYQVCNATFVNNVEPHTYINVYNCTGEENDVREARLSFPSGHSSMAMYFATYMVLYTYFRLKYLTPVRNCLFTLTLVAYIVVTAVVSSRVNDYRHHWTDVIAGMMIGLIIAVGNLTLFTDLPRIAPRMNCLTKVRDYSKDNQMEEGNSTDMESFQREISAQVAIIPANN